jgi:hypothetical protein
VKARPLYLVRELLGFGDDDSRLASSSPAPHT